MKKMFLSAMVAMFFAAGMAQGAQTTKTADPAKKETAKPMLKEHVCTAACKDGKHVYAHGEKGHVCTDACHKKM